VCLTNAVDLGIREYAFLAEVHPFLDALRRDPRFVRLLVSVEERWRTFTA
jgi:hypothetical protein